MRTISAGWLAILWLLSACASPNAAPTPTQPASQPARTQLAPAETPSAATATDESWRTFDDPRLGLTFRYPAAFGPVDLTIEPGETGQRFEGRFAEFAALQFGGVSADYS